MNASKNVNNVIQLYIVALYASTSHFKLFSILSPLDRLDLKVVTGLERSFDNSERMENLSYAIGYYRKKKGYSQEQMAELLGISRQHLASVEAPGMNRGVSLELIFNIATVLEIEPYLLFKFKIEK